MINGKNGTVVLDCEQEFLYPPVSGIEGTSPSIAVGFSGVVGVSDTPIFEDGLGNPSDDFRFLESRDSKLRSRTPPIPKEEYIVLKQRNRKKFATDKYPKTTFAELTGVDFYWKSDYQEEPTPNNIYNPDTNSWEPRTNKKHPRDFELFNPYNIKPHSCDDTFYFKIYFQVHNPESEPWEFTETFSGYEAGEVIRWLQKKHALGLGCRAIPVRWNNYKARFKLNQSTRKGAYRCRVHRKR